MFDYKKGDHVLCMKDTLVHFVSAAAMTSGVAVLLCNRGGVAFPKTEEPVSCLLCIAKMS